MVYLASNKREQSLKFSNTIKHYFMSGSIKLALTVVLAVLIAGLIQKNVKMLNPSA